MATTITGSTSSSYWTHKIVVTENSTSVENNTSSVTVTAYIGRSSSAGASYMYGASISDTISITGCSSQTITYNNSGTVNISAGGWLNIGSTTFSSVPHNSDGSKTVTVSSSFTTNISPASGSASGSVTLSTIPRASSISCSGGNIGSSTTISISRYSSSFTHTITYSFSGLTGTIATKTTSTSISWTIPTSFYAKIPNSNSGTGTLTCTTYSGSTSVGTSTCSFTAKVTNSNPTFTSFSTWAAQESETPTGTYLLETLTGNDKTIIKNYSELVVNITNLATAKNSASISYYQCEGVKTYYDSSIVNVIISVDKYSKDTATVYAVDTRGNSTSVTQDIDFIEYEDVTKGKMSVSRSDNGVGEFVTLTFNGTFWNGNFGALDNELEISYKYKKTDSTTYTTGKTTITPTISDNSFSFSGLISGDTEDNGFEIEESYDIVVTVQDCISYVTYEGIIGAGTPAISVYKNKVALGDKYDTSLGGIQLWGDIYINGVKFEVSE